MTRTPRVSVGLPVRNGTNYLRDALDSLLSQTLTDFELIIGDNASTDDTEEICREFAARTTASGMCATPSTLGVRATSTSSSVRHRRRTLSRDHPASYSRAVVDSAPEADWLDPRGAPPVGHWRMRVLRGCARAIGAAPLGARDRAECWAQLGHLTVAWRRYLMQEASASVRDKGRQRRR